MVLDTNALFLPFRVGLALDREVGRLVPGAELVVPASVLAEVDRLVARGVRHAAAARALAGSFRCVPTQSRGDAAVLEAALQEQADVVTADAALARRLLTQGITVYAPRDRSRLDRVVLSRAARPVARTVPPRRAAATVKKRTRLESRRASDARRRPHARPAER